MKILSKIKPINGADFKIADAEDIEMGNADLKTITTRNISILDSQINVKFPPPPLKGAVGDGITDDTDAIKNIISYMKAKYNDNDYMGKINTITFSNGIYKITSQIEIPTFIHLKALGTVEIDSYVENNSAIWYNNSIDPNIDGGRRDWFRGKTTGKLIDGGTGGFFIKNKCSSINYDGEYFRGNNAGAIGIEFGSRQDTGNILAHFEVSNLRVELFHIGIKLNDYHLYIAKFSHCASSFCDIGIQYAGDVNGTDSGENMSFDFCTIANNRLAFDIEQSGWCPSFFNFNTCSIDYNYLVLLNNNSYASTVKFNNCHIEGFYSPSYAKEVGTQLQPISDGYFGLVKNVKSEGTNSLSVIINNSLLGVLRGSGKIIDGVARRTNVSFDNVQIFSDASFDDKYTDDDWLFMCTDNVNVLKADIQYVDNLRGSYISKNQILMENPCFENVKEGTKFKDGDLCGDVNIYWSENVENYSVINDNKINKKCLQVSFENSPHFLLLTKKGIPANVGDVFCISFSIKFTGDVNYLMTLCDSENRDNSISNHTDSIMTNHTDEWKTMSTREYLTVTEKGFTGYALPKWCFYFNKNSTTNNIRITDLNVIKIK